MSRSGANLALLLLGGFRALANAATAELANRGYSDFRPAHDFALRAIAAGAGTASELGRSLSVTKQAAAKTISSLQEHGYIATGVDANDARRKQLHVTARGFEVLKAGEAIFDGLRDQWKKEIGVRRLEEMERSLTKLLKVAPNGMVDPGWVEHEDGSSE